MKRHHFIIIGGFCYLAIFLIIGLIIINNAFDSSGTRLNHPHNLVIGLVLISQSLVVFVIAIWYAVKTRVKDDI